MLDRTVPPPFKPVRNIDFPWPAAMELRPGIPLFVLDRGPQPLIKLELLFESGTWYEPQHGAAYFTAKMLQEGTRKQTATEISAYLDYYGAELSINIKPDYCSMVLLTLSKYLTPMLALLRALLLEPTFSSEQLHRVKNLKNQAIKIENEKYDQVALKYIKAALLGNDHPYGYSLTTQDIAAIMPELLQQYYQGQLLAGCKVLMSGAINSQDIEVVKDCLQDLPLQEAASVRHPKPIKLPTALKVYKENSLQTAIVIGKLLFTKNDPDYLPMRFVCELLGGYFGSRLMRNIREDKGYTYGIYADIVPLKHTSYLLIATEVIHDFSEQSCLEIYHEITRLQTEVVPQEELQRLKNYLIGQFMHKISTCWSIMECFKEAHLHGLGKDFYEQFYDTVSHIDSVKIQELAHQYLALDSLSEVQVG